MVDSDGRGVSRLGWSYLFLFGLLAAAGGGGLSLAVFSHFCGCVVLCLAQVGECWRSSSFVVRKRLGGLATPKMGR